MKVTIKDDKVYVRTPYAAHLPKLFRNMGGTWENPNWVFANDPDIIEGLKSQLTDEFGWDGMSKTRPIKIRATETHWAMNEPVNVAGFELAIARGKNSGATTGSDVTLLSGSIDSVGSVKNWKSAVEAGSRLQHGRVWFLRWRYGCYRSKSRM